MALAPTSTAPPKNARPRAGSAFPCHVGTCAVRRCARHAMIGSSITMWMFTENKEEKAGFGGDPSCGRVPVNGSKRAVRVCYLVPACHYKSEETEEKTYVDGRTAELGASWALLPMTQLLGFDRCSRDHTIPQGLRDTNKEQMLLSWRCMKMYKTAACKEMRNLTCSTTLTHASSMATRHVG